MKKYSCLSAIPRSFYSADLYRDVANNWRWTTFWYLCLIVAICSIPTTMLAQRLLTFYGTHFINEYVVQAPVIYITDGVARTPEKHPYLILDPQTKNIVAMIDTTGQHTNVSKEKFDTLITAKSIIQIDREDDSVKVEDFPPKLTVTVNPTEIQKQAPHYFKWAWVWLYPLIVFVSIIFRFLLALFYALLGKLVAMFSEINLMYETIVKLAMVALTPVMFVNAILILSGLTFRMEGWLLFMIGIGYVFYAVRVNEKDL